jgi:hypothetical protein
MNKPPPRRSLPPITRWRTWRVGSGALRSFGSAGTPWSTCARSRRSPTTATGSTECGCVTGSAARSRSPAAGPRGWRPCSRRPACARPRRTGGGGDRLSSFGETNKTGEDHPFPDPDRNGLPPMIAPPMPSRPARRGFLAAADHKVLFLATLGWIVVHPSSPSKHGVHPLAPNALAVAVGQRLRPLGQETAGPSHPGLYCFKTRVGRRAKGCAPHSGTRAPRGQPTCRNPWNSHRNAIEVPGSRARSPRHIAMPLRGFRPRPLGPASLSFVKPVTGFWRRLSQPPPPWR